MTTQTQFTRERAGTDAEASLREFCSLLRSVEHPDATAVGTWTIRDVAAHLNRNFEPYIDMLRGAGSPVLSIDDIAAFNDAMIATAEATSVVDLAAALESKIPEFAAAVDDAGPDPLGWHAGIRLPVETFCALMIGEALVHGYDIARADNKPWHIDPAAVRTAFVGLLPLLPYYVDEKAAAGFRARIELTLRGEEEATAFLAFDDGRLAIERDARGPIDCHISADPVAFMLVSYGRIGPVAPALTGKMVAWGRKPWLGFKVPKLLKSP
ncbi:MAG: maleylpyruvate isomerase family mycothiol-dependent enzyme [Actinomycetota bacterium]